MKKIVLTIITIIYSLASTAFADNPSYTLTAKNFILVNPNTLEFEIYLKHTNPEQSSPLKYSGGQYYMTFNENYSNGGMLTYTTAPGNANDISDLPAASQPRNPMVHTNILRMAPGASAGPSSMPLISTAGSGTKILKLRLHTTAASFAGNLNLAWRNSGAGSTKISGYVNGAPVNLTNPAGHLINSGSIIANIKLAIEGLYNPGTNTLNSKEIVSAYLRNANSPYGIADSGSAQVDSITQTGNFNFVNAAPGVYYIVVKHRNSLETWSKSGGESFTNSSALNYDFTGSASQAYGNNLKQLGTKYCIFSGDVNQDGAVDLSDVSAIDNDIYNFTFGNTVTDLNGDDFVDVSDILICDNNSFGFVSLIRP